MPAELRASEDGGMSITLFLPACHEIIVRNLLTGKRLMLYYLHLPNGENHGKVTQFLSCAIIRLWSMASMLGLYTENQSIRFSFSFSQLLSLTSRSPRHGYPQRTTGLLMPSPVLSLRRLLIYFHSSSFTTTQFTHPARVGSRCRSYGQGCRPSLVWTRFQYSTSLSSGTDDL